MTDSIPSRARQIAEEALGAGPEADKLAADIYALARETVEPYSAALDEVYRLRGLCAHSAYALKAHLEYKTFPTSRRALAQNQVERLLDAARGSSGTAVADLNLSPLFRLLGLPTTLTRWQFEQSLPKRTPHP